MATDGTKILYNPTWIYALPISQVAGVICHEIMHCILSHNTRRNNRDPYLWNIACDYAVNNIISKAEIELPAYSLINRQYDNMTAEKIYDELMKMSEDTISSMSRVNLEILETSKELMLQYLNKKDIGKCRQLWLLFQQKL